MDLTPRQRDFVFSSPGRLSTFRADSSALGSFAEESLALLGKEKTFRLFAQLNPDASRGPGTNPLLPPPNAVGFDRDCHCNQVGDFCDWGFGNELVCKDKTGCKEVWLCGWFLFQRCNGLCRAPDYAGPGGPILDPIDPIDDLPAD